MIDYNGVKAMYQEIQYLTPGNPNSHTTIVVDRKKIETIQVEKTDVDLFKVWISTKRENMYVAENLDFLSVLAVISQVEKYYEIPQGFVKWG